MDVTSSHPGFAVTRRPPTAGPFDFAALTSDVLALIGRWSPGRPAELIGHDWGALITYDACVTAPKRIERAAALAIPHPLTFMSRLTHPDQLGRSPIPGRSRGGMIWA